MQSAALATQKASAEFAARFRGEGIQSIPEEKHTSGVEEEKPRIEVPKPSTVDEKKPAGEEDVGDKLDTSTTHADTEPPNSPVSRIPFHEGGEPQERGEKE